ncbi:MAG: type II toxin-antitoxin system VapC family toxin [Elainellaceae cyanobacterium]
MIFVDTGAWFASAVPSDSDHSAATQWLKQNVEPLLTTDYIIDETLTLLRMRREQQRALALGEAFFSGRLSSIYYLTDEDVRATWQIFRQFSDKNWSFTDCASKGVIEKLNISQAFALIIIFVSLALSRLCRNSFPCFSHLVVGCINDAPIFNARGDRSYRHKLILGMNWVRAFGQTPLQPLSAIALYSSNGQRRIAR